MICSVSNRDLFIGASEKRRFCNRLHSNEYLVPTEILSEYCEWRSVWGLGGWISRLLRRAHRVMVIDQ